MSDWVVYMVRCRDGSLYTGITNNIDKRIAEHNDSNATAAKYTRSRRPVTLVYQESLPSKSAALKRECAIKKLKKAEKESLLRQA